MSDQNRREFLFNLGAGTAGFLTLGLFSGCQDEFMSKVAGSEVSFLTPAEDGEWYWKSGKGIAKKNAPSIPSDEWSLQLRAADQSVAEIRYEDLLNYEANGQSIIYWKTMRCVLSTQVGSPFSTWMANGLFKGIPLHLILEDAGIDESAWTKLRTFASDGFESNIDARRAFQSGSSPLPVIVAYELNGQPLPRLRGGPARLIVPEMWGFKNIKWLSKLELTQDDSYFGTYETQIFGSADAETRQRIDSPAAMALDTIVSTPSGGTPEIEGPDVTVAGASVVGQGRIGTVQCQLDDGAFEPAFIKSLDSHQAALTEPQRALAQQAAQHGEPYPWPNIWVTWSKTYRNLSPGTHTITVRALDAEGNRQVKTPNQIMDVRPHVPISFKIV